MSKVLIKFKKINMTCISRIMSEKLKYDLNSYEMNTMCNNFLFSDVDFIRRMGGDCYGLLSVELEVHRIAREIGEDYDFIEDEIVGYDGIANRFTIEVKGQADRFTDSMRYFKPFVNSNSSDEDWRPEYNLEPLRINFDNDKVAFDPEPVRRYLEEDRKAVLDAYKRIPKTFTVYSGYSRDGRLRTVVHWQDGVKTSVYLQNEDFDDIYIAIAYCYVKRKFGNLSHFKRIVERNTKDVTGVAKRFIYGGDSTLLVNMYNTYDQVALYLAISYLGDTDQWLTEEDKERLEDSVNE